MGGMKALKFLLHSKESSRAHFGDQKVDGFGCWCFLDLHWVWSSCHLKFWRRCWSPHICRLAYHKHVLWLLELRLVEALWGTLTMEVLRYLQIHRPGIAIFITRIWAKTNKQINSYLNSAVWFSIDIKNDWHQNHIANHHDKNTHCYFFEKNGPDGIRPKFDTEISSHWHETCNCVTWNENVGISFGFRLCSN